MISEIVIEDINAHIKVKAGCCLIFCVLLQCVITSLELTWLTSHAIVSTVRTVCTASYARTLHCITVVHYDAGGALLLTSDELSLRASTGQSDVIQKASYIIAVISTTDLLASQLSQEQLIYVANSLCVVCTSQKEIPARLRSCRQICHSCQLASHQLTRYVRWIFEFVWWTNLLKCRKDLSELCTENIEKERLYLFMFSKYFSNYNEIHPLRSCSRKFRN